MDTSDPITPELGLMEEMVGGSLGVGVGSGVTSWATQWVPPSVVFRIVPESPTAHKVFALAAVIPLRELFVPEVWGFQPEPPFVVWNIVPTAPTTQTVLTSVAAIP